MGGDYYGTVHLWGSSVWVLFHDFVRACITLGVCGVERFD